MAKLQGTHLIQLSKKALNAVPQGLIKAVGEEITSKRVLISFAIVCVFLLIARVSFGTRKKLPPGIPGALPVLGNLLQLTDKKPHRTFTAWARKYGPIFTIKVGSVTQVVVNNAELTKEVMVTKYDSISQRKVPMAMQVITADKTMVTMSDYGEEHRMLKKLLVTNLLGLNIQNKNRSLREEALVSLVDGVLTELKCYPQSTGLVNVREHVRRALFSFAMIQVWGYVPDQIAVPELAASLSTLDIFAALTVAPVKVLINVDWRDFFPALKWLPNPSVERKVREVDFNRNAVMNALIREQLKRLANLKEPPRFYADILLTEATYLTETQLLMLLWEPIVESTDTTLLTMEWAMYELAKHPECQERLYKEILTVAGTERMVTEDDLPNMPYLKAVIKETLLQYPPVPLVPPRLVEEDITLAGYDIPKGQQILLNLYAVAKDPAVWSDPEKWDPERVLGDTSLDMGFKNFNLVPFGAGKRMCAGIAQTMFIISMSLAALVQHCEWRLSPEEIENVDKKMEDMVFLTTHKLNALTCIGVPRVAHRLP